ncbi:MAG: flavodoxin family protein [Candidatus Puniceispirillaceae bacterium]
MRPQEVQIEDGLACDGIMLGTIENIGYMSGMTKDMFDRCYNGWLDRQAGLPACIYIRAGLDGTATRQAINAIATGLKWRLVQPPIVLKGSFCDSFGDTLSEQAAGFAAGLEQGIF